MFSKGLSKADSFASEVRSESEGVSLAASWSQRHFTLRVKSLWNKLIWLLPLFRTSVNLPDVHSDGSVSWDFVSTEVYVFLE